MLTWMFFCFLWDDPLFNSRAETEGRYLTDPEFVELRRRARLEALEILYIRLDKLRTWKEHWREDIAREVWTWKQLIEHVPREIAERVQIERQVNTMDPDFSFAKAVWPDK